MTFLSRLFEQGFSSPGATNKFASKAARYIEQTMPTAIRFGSLSACNFAPFSWQIAHYFSHLYGANIMSCQTISANPFAVALGNPDLPIDEITQKNRSIARNGLHFRPPTPIC